MHNIIPVPSKSILESRKDTSLHDYFTTNNTFASSQLHMDNKIVSRTTHSAKNTPPIEQKNVLLSNKLTTNKCNTKHQISLKPLFSSSVNKAIHNTIDITNSYSPTPAQIIQSSVIAAFQYSNITTRIHNPVQTVAHRHHNKTNRT